MCFQHPCPAQKWAIKTQAVPPAVPWPSWAALYQKRMATWKIAKPAQGDFNKTSPGWSPPIKSFTHLLPPKANLCCSPMDAPQFQFASSGNAKHWVLTCLSLDMVYRGLHSIREQVSGLEKVHSKTKVQSVMMVQGEKSSKGEWGGTLGRQLIRGTLKAQRWDLTLGVSSSLVFPESMCLNCCPRYSDLQNMDMLVVSGRINFQKLKRAPGLCILDSLDGGQKYYYWLWAHGQEDFFLVKAPSLKENVGIIYLTNIFVHFKCKILRCTLQVLLKFCIQTKFSCLLFLSSGYRLCLNYLQAFSQTLRTSQEQQTRWPVDKRSKHAKFVTF